MAHPIPIIVGTTIAVIGGGYALKKFVYDPHVAPFIEAVIAQHRANRQERRERTVRGEYECIAVANERRDENASRNDFETQEKRKGLFSGRYRKTEESELRHRRPAEMYELDDSKLLPQERGQSPLPTQIPTTYTPRVPRRRQAGVNTVEKEMAPSPSVGEQTGINSDRDLSRVCKSDSGPATKHSNHDEEVILIQGLQPADAHPALVPPRAQTPLILSTHTSFSIIDADEHSPPHVYSPGVTSPSVLSADADPRLDRSGVLVEPVDADPSTPTYALSPFRQHSPYRSPQSPAQRSATLSLRTPSPNAGSLDDIEIISVSGTTTSYVDAETYSPPTLSPMTVSRRGSSGSRGVLGDHPLEVQQLGSMVTLRLPQMSPDGSLLASGDSAELIQPHTSDPSYAASAASGASQGPPHSLCSLSDNESWEGDWDRLSDA